MKSGWTHERRGGAVKSGAFDYLLKDIEQERLVRLDDIIHDAQGVQPPPNPPPRREPSRPIHITIDLRPERREKPKTMGFLARLTLVIWAVVVLGFLTSAHGQPVEWRSQQEGFLTRMQGTDRNGRNWTGTSYQQGHLTIIDANGPNGEVVHCTTQKQGFQTITQCD